MTDNDAVLVGGPGDGTTFEAEGAGLVELEYEEMVHRYIPTTQAREGMAVYTYDGVVDPGGASDGAEDAQDRMASPLARDMEDRG
ncbi:hypothetical protein [Luedemannella helvata]|uniref:Uncharacterized protein n=1 Tax=Luedemannella helvata TaxID=349315 RepID=A0ABN2KAA4_9ACTN